MPKIVIPFTTEDAWLAARVHDITSTECAALFNVSPYTTTFELFHTKRAAVVERRDPNPRMVWGQRLQEPIARGVAHDHGMEIRKMDEYIRDPAARIGSSFDYRIVGARGKGERPPWVARLMSGEGLMEIKTVDPFEFKSNWSIVDGDVVEAPPHIELQVQHQLVVSGLQWALIVALIGGNRVSVIERAYEPRIGAAILQKAAEFWALVDSGTPPAPDYARDAELIARQHVESVAGETMNARDDDELETMVRDYQHVAVEIVGRESRRKELRARILERIGTASRVFLRTATLTAGTVRESVVPAHTRSAYRNLRVSTYNPKG